MPAIVRAALAAALTILGLWAGTAHAASGLFSGSHFSAQAGLAGATTHVVNSTSFGLDAAPGDGVCETAAGNGVCGIRTAIHESNFTPGVHETITFDIPGPAPHTIVASGGIGITDAVTVDATTEPGYSGSPVILLDGPNTSAGGLQITASGATVRGLAIGSFGYGVYINGGDDNVIAGNWIGPDLTGNSSSSTHNLHDGVMLLNGASGNTIGGTAAGDRNVISGNGSVAAGGPGRGVVITGAGSTGNVVAGNLIGTRPSGTAALGNSNFGVVVTTAGNLIGGDDGTTPGGPCTGSCNVISGNASGGISPGSGTTIEGNFIGLNASGSANIGNGADGIEVRGDNNVIGGTTPEARNVIASSSFANITIDNATDPAVGNIVQGNFIGTDPTGTADRSPGGNYGVVTEGGNTIGGSTGTTPGGACTGACNVIAGNGSHGIAIDRRGGPTIEGNFIGLNANGTAALANGGDGIYTFQPNNTIGGTTAAARNVIAGNAQAGIELGTTGNVVQGNFIGTNSAGTAVIGNAQWGVDVAAGSNTIGGTTGVTPGGACTGQCNLIGSMVVRVATLIQGNYVGTNAAGTSGIGGGGIQVASAPNVVIGGDAPAERNVLSGNNGSGVFIHGPSSAGATNTTLHGNYIGVGADGTTPVSNGGDGVVLGNNSSGAKVGGTGPGEGNVIAHNTGDGVWNACRGASTSISHRIVGNSIHSNGGLGIDLCPDAVSTNDAGDADTLPPNEGQNFPVLTSASPGPATAVKGTLNSRPNATHTIDFYSSDTCDPALHGEGRSYLGATTVTTDGSGNASFDVTLGATPSGHTVVTATSTSPANSTSEFSKCLSYARPKAASPVTVSLVPAYRQCTSPNRIHGPALAHPSCGPPQQESGDVTVGTPDANGRAPKFAGAAAYRVVVGDATTMADEADVRIDANMDDVRARSDLSDYTGELTLESTVRITDKLNGAAQNEDATVVDIPLPMTISCTGTPDTTVGSTCAATTTADALVPGSVRETKRTIWQMGAIRVLDGGPDGVASTPGNAVFATQGVFVP